MSDFLKKMQQALVTGEKDEELAEFLNEIDKKADEVEDPKKAVEARMANAGEKEADEDKKKLSQEEIAEFNKKVEDELKTEDEKWAMLAIIENMKSELGRIAKAYQELKKKYEEDMKEIQANIDKSVEEFEKNFGEVDTTSNFDKIKEDFDDKKEKE